MPKGTKLEGRNSRLTDHMKHSLWSKLSGMMVGIMSIALSSPPNFIALLSSPLISLSFSLSLLPLLPSTLSPSHFLFVKGIWFNSHSLNIHQYLNMEQKSLLKNILIVFQTSLRTSIQILYNVFFI